MFAKEGEAGAKWEGTEISTKERGIK